MLSKIILFCNLFASFKICSKLNKSFWFQPESFVSVFLMNKKKLQIYVVQKIESLNKKDINAFANKKSIRLFLLFLANKIKFELFFVFGAWDMKSIRLSCFSLVLEIVQFIWKLFLIKLLYCLCKLKENSFNFLFHYHHSTSKLEIKNDNNNNNKVSKSIINNANIYYKKRVQ